MINSIKLRINPPHNSLALFINAAKYDHIFVVLFHRIKPRSCHWATRLMYLCNVHIASLKGKGGYSLRKS